MLDMPEQHMPETFRSVQRDLLDDYIGFGERDTAELGCRID
jgi:hypothetical protein